MKRLRQSRPQVGLNQDGELAILQGFGKVDPARHIFSQISGMAQHKIKIATPVSATGDSTAVGLDLSLWNVFG